MPSSKARNKEWADWKDTGEKVAMGERVGRILSDLQETACIHVEQREQIAFARMYSKLCPEDKEFNEFLEKQAIPALKVLGYNRFYRDVITDLALALGRNKRQSKVRQKFDKNLL